MRRTLRLVVILAAFAAVSASAATVAAPAASGADRMWVGFHDDPSYRWVTNREERIARAASDGSTIVRLLVLWNQAAPRRPAQATNPFDPAYRLDDVDEAVRSAQKMDQEVMITISGTPRWANGGQAPNRMPRNVRDFTNFARAVASRYSGRFAGFPYVRFWSIWNEPNLQLFLAPQFDARGRSVAPANYAKLYAAGYAGLKAGNRTAQIAIGETSARGSDKATGIRPTHSPGKFAELVAKANPRLKYAAWAVHPYPSTPNLRPGQIVKWPNVSLSSLPRFRDSLNTWFRQKNNQIWVTEYGHQTRPQDSLGVSYATQSAYISQAIALAKKYPFVGMFIWFVYQDDPGQEWESGLYTQAGSAKGRSPNRFSASARPLDARNATHTFRRGTSTPLVKLYTRRFCAADKPGTAIGMTWRIFRGNRLLNVDQQTSPLGRDCTIAARLRWKGGGIARGVTYTVTFELNDINGDVLNRKLTVRGT